MVTLLLLYSILITVFSIEYVREIDIDGVTEQDEEYESLRFNDMFATFKGEISERDNIFKPGMIFTPSNEDEIVKIVKYANKYDKIIVVKSGGHSYSGLSTCNDINCIQIRMDNFNYTNLNYDDESDPNKLTSITVGSGQKLGDMHKQLNGYNVSILSGICEGVGAGGHYQTSSIGGLGRSLGLGMDYINKIKVITADGNIVIAERNKNSKYYDLYWAILGGSPGAFGIVIEYIFEPIRDENYPNSYAAAYVFKFTSQTFKQSMNIFFDLLNNPIYQKTTDMGMIITVNPLLSNPDDTESQFANGLFLWLTWTGINHGDIHSIIPGTNDKTYYDEFFLPWKTIDGAIPIREHIDGHLPISTISKLYVTNELALPVEPFRYYNWNRNFDLNMIDKIGEFGVSQYVDKFMDSMDYITQLNPNDIDIMFQMWNLNTPKQIVRGNQIDINPINNLNSYPLRNVMVQIDSWILFGGNDMEKKTMNEKLLKEAMFYKNKLKHDSGSDITNENNEDIRTFAFSDCNYDSCDLSKNWRFYYNHNSQLNDQLKQIKNKYDKNDMFDAPLTIPADNTCSTTDKCQ